MSNGGFYQNEKLIIYPWQDIYAYTKYNHLFKNY